MNVDFLHRGQQHKHDDSACEAVLAVKVECLKVLVHAFLAEVKGMEQVNHQSALNLREEVRRFETTLISSALRQSGGNLKLAAGLLGTKTTTLSSKLRSHRIPVEDSSGFGR